MPHAETTLLFIKMKHFILLSFYLLLLTLISLKSSELWRNSLTTINYLSLFLTISARKDYVPSSIPVVSLWKNSDISASSPIHHQLGSFRIQIYLSSVILCKDSCMLPTEKTLDNWIDISFYS